MKRKLLALTIIVSSFFIADAQYEVGGVKVNVGQVQGTINGNKVIANPSTGQYQVVGSDGTSVRVNGQGTSIQSGNTILNIGNGAGGAGNSNFSVGSASCTSGTGLMGLLRMTSCLMGVLVPLLISVAVVVFFWFIVLFIWKGSDSPDEQQKAKKGMLWSVIALFVMVSIWGIIALMGSVLGIDQGGSIDGFKLPGEK